MKNSPMISVELGVLLHRAPSTRIPHFSALLLSALAGLTAGTATAARAENARAMKVDEMSFIGEMQTVRSLGWSRGASLALYPPDIRNTRYMRSRSVSVGGSPLMI
jgi:hypothetical protein